MVTVSLALWFTGMGNPKWPDGYYSLNLVELYFFSENQNSRPKETIGFRTRKNINVLNH
jgi:hypothetical protein